MSHDGNGGTCKFGHVLQTNTNEDKSDVKGGIDGKIRKKIEEGKIGNLEELENAHEKFDDIESPQSIGSIVGEPYKHLKIQARSQGLPRAAALDAADKWDEDLDYGLNKTEEKIYVAPQSNLHGEYMQRRNQAEQNIRNTMQNISTLTKQKHMLEHDIRKLRSRAENMRSGDENIIKGDFIELVDGAGAAGQGGDEASLKFYRDQNFYPSIVADFQEMRSLEDLDEGGRLEEIPNNEKAILRKKWAMYEKWKDLYGSEIQRKLKELKQQLNSVESSIEQTKEWLEPYARDMTMINEGSLEDLKAEMNFPFMFKGTSSLIRRMEFIAHKPMVNDHGTLKIAGDGDEPTHYRVIYLDVTHVNLAGWEQPQSPAQGPSTAVIQLYPIITCKHVFENFFQEKIDRQKDLLEQVVKDYTGRDIETKEGKKLRKARNGEKMSVEELRRKVAEKADSNIPVEFSSTVRRVEDGIDQPSEFNDRYAEDGENIVSVIEDILDTELAENGSEDDESKMYTGLEKSVRSFTGQVDEFKIPNDESPLEDLRQVMKLNYYYDFKLGLGLYTMN